MIHCYFAKYFLSSSVDSQHDNNSCEMLNTESTSPPVQSNPGHMKSNSWDEPCQTSELEGSVPLLGRCAIVLLRSTSTRY